MQPIVKPFQALIICLHPSLSHGKESISSIFVKQVQGQPLCSPQFYIIHFIEQIYFIEHFGFVNVFGTPFNFSLQLWNALYNHYHINIVFFNMMSSLSRYLLSSISHIFCLEGLFYLSFIKSQAMRIVSKSVFVPSRSVDMHTTSSTALKFFKIDFLNLSRKLSQVTLFPHFSIVDIIFCLFMGSHQ